MIRSERPCGDTTPLARAGRPSPPGAASFAALAWLLAAVAFAFAGCASNPRDLVDPAGSKTFAAGVDPFVLVREAADHEGLYTLAGGLKPMSSGIWRHSFSTDDPDLSELRDARRALAILRNDAWYADVQVFADAHDGERAAHAFVIHRKALARMIERHEVFWSPWGITPCTHPSEIVAVVDRMPRGDRWRGYGYLFGYPDEAVDFFVEAGLSAGDGRGVGPGKDRRFIQIPTAAEASGRFTYAVPPEHVPSTADEALARDSEVILAAYLERRHRMRDAGSAVEELLRLNAIFEPRTIRRGPIEPDDASPSAP